MKPLKRRSLPSWCPCVSVGVAVVCLGLGQPDLSVRGARDVRYHSPPFVTRCYPHKSDELFFLGSSYQPGGFVYQKWRFFQIGQAGRGEVQRSKSAHFFLLMWLSGLGNYNE